MSTELKPRYFTFATAGHVDHGKTSVLRALTGIDPDRLKEEKQRQMTTDIGFAHLNFPVQADGSQLVLGFIDVPGHGKFLKNMLAGVGGIQMALLVVAADEGPMPQTISHVKILSLLGVRKALVVLTKIDVADESRQSEVEQSVRDLLNRYQIQCMGVSRISNTQNKGFDELKQMLGAVVENLEHPSSTGGALLPIDRVFSKTGYGVVITGTLLSGQFAVGDNIVIEPGEIKGRIRGLETFKKQLQSASAGQRLAVNISLKENKTLVRGQVVAGTNVPVVTTLIVRVEQIGNSEEWLKPEDLQDQPIRLYHGTAECFGHLRWCQQIESEQSLVAQVVLADPVVAEPGDRFVIRFGDEGISGGTILVTNRPRWMTRNKLNAFAGQLINHEFNSAVEYFLEHMTQAAAKREALTSFLPIADRQNVIDECVASGSVLQESQFLISAKRALSVKQQIQALVSAKNDSQEPPEYSIEAVRVKVSNSIDRQLFQHFLKELTDSGVLSRNGDKISAKRDKAPAISQEQMVLNDRILEVLNNTVCVEIEEISKVLKTDKKLVLLALQNLAKHERAQIVDHDFASSASAIKTAHECLAKIWQSKKEISPSEFRESLGTSRKYAMALLAYFDNKLITRRINNTRMLIKTPVS